MEGTNKFEIRKGLKQIRLNALILLDFELVLVQVKVEKRKYLILGIYNVVSHINIYIKHSGIYVYMCLMIGMRFY